MKEKLLIGITILILVVGLIILYTKKGVSSDYNFRIYFFRAGKADAILVSKNNKHILIDTGEESLKEEILNYFKKHNITKLEYLIITHFDKDHVGSASSIIDNIEIGEVLQSNYPKDSTYYNNYLNSLSKKSIDPLTVLGDLDLYLEGIKIVVNGPEEVYEKDESNNSSLIISILDGNNKFLLMGDAEKERIEDYLNTNKDTYDFIKIPYHGNYQKKLDDLLKSTSPKYAVMTCSKEEGCETKTIELLKSNNIKYYMTKNNPITVYSNGEKILMK